MYKNTNWIDRVVDLESGEVIQEGTDQSAANFNNMEHGISDAHLATALFCQAIAMSDAKNMIAVLGGSIPPGRGSEDGAYFEYPDGFTSKNCVVLNKMWGDGPEGSTWLEGNMFDITLYREGVKVQLSEDYSYEEYVKIVLFKYA